MLVHIITSKKFLTVEKHLLEFFCALCHSALSSWPRGVLSGYPDANPETDSSAWFSFSAAPAGAFVSAGQYSGLPDLQECLQEMPSAVKLCAREQKAAAGMVR